MEQIAMTASDSTVDVLREIKDSLSRCVALARRTQSQGLIASDDIMFIRETIRRYIPDTIKSYLQIPPKDRETKVIEDGKCASALMHEQITLIQDQLAKREDRLSQLAGEPLLQQQRFLASKARE
jgi:hypothetical protein